MRALQIVELTGPPNALRQVEIPEPEPSHFLTPGTGVVIDVRNAGVSFPDVLYTRGEYQLKPPLPFVPGSEVSGIVRTAPPGAPFRTGDRVMAFCMLGGFAEVAVAPVSMTFPLPEELDFAQGASLVLNYHTAYFSLVTRGRLAAGEWVLVHGAAGGVGTATLQVAAGLGARTIAVVSSDEKERVAREAGAHYILRSAGPWKDEVRALSEGGVHLIVDPVGGDRFPDSLRTLREGGRLVVVGSTGGGNVKLEVNPLLLKNIDVIGAGWGSYVRDRPHANREIGAAVNTLVAGGAVRPLVGARFPFDRAADALAVIDGRSAMGKVVLDLA
jgi:NADPH2:quinone reductase